MILIIFGIVMIIVISILLILTALSGHILKDGKILEKETGIKWFFSKILLVFSSIFAVYSNPFFSMVFWLVERHWWFNGPFRRLLPWILANGITRIAYSGEIYTTEETVAILEKIYDDADKRKENGEHLHISISPCMCRDAIDNWSDDMPNLTCMHFQFMAEPMSKFMDQSLLISGETAIHLVKEYAAKWPFVHIFYGMCPGGPEYFDKQIALCFCHHHCVTMRCEIKWGKYGLHPFKKGDHLAMIDESDCKNCGTCIEKCPFFAISQNTENNDVNDKIPYIDHEQCYGCGVCERFCPNDAIYLIDRPNPKNKFIKKEIIYSISAKGVE
ncbi:MAG: 4Fe-4S dicluster domain-containing protein [Promethearchaeota archaeon]|nr:MAG: 4Fe-4S dicluster domain-containing protein [Candidatus Lokiarchaeota archaeon]